jgi:hypothetical protein
MRVVGILFVGMFILWQIATGCIIGKGQPRRPRLMRSEHPGQFWVIVGWEILVLTIAIYFGGRH